ncbi:MAG: hypothetical protein Q9183_002937 [Haloplaca sp. 2 TL-2023]
MPNRFILGSYSPAASRNNLSLRKQRLPIFLLFSLIHWTHVRPVSALRQIPPTWKHHLNHQSADLLGIELQLLVIRQLHNSRARSLLQRGEDWLESVIQYSAAPSPQNALTCNHADYDVSNLYEDVIKIRVGPDGEPFHVYKELVKRDAAFFKTALDGSFSEGTTQEISLPEDDVHTFRIYQTWLITGELRYNFDDEGLWLTLSKLWIFADKICSPRFENRIIDAIFDILAENDNENLPVASADTVHYVYDHTVKGSRLRRLFTRCFIQLAPQNKRLVAYPSEFLAAVISRLRYDTASWDSVKRAHGVAAVQNQRSRYYNTKDMGGPGASFVSQSQ